MKRRIADNDEQFRAEFGDFVEGLPLQLAENYKKEEFWVPLESFASDKVVENFTPVQKLSRFGYLILSQNYQSLLRDYLKEHSDYSEKVIEDLVKVTGLFYRRTFFGVGAAHHLIKIIAKEVGPTVEVVL